MVVPTDLLEEAQFVCLGIATHHAKNVADTIGKGQSGVRVSASTD
jgi:hypothetical protein